MPESKKIDLASKKQADLMTLQLIEGYRDGTEAAKLFDGLISRLSAKVKELSNVSDPKDILLLNTVSGLLRSAKVLKERCLKTIEAEEEKKRKEQEYRKRARLAAYYYVESVKLARSLSMEPIPEKLGNYTYGNELRKLMAPFRKKWDEMTIERWKVVGRENGMVISEMKLSTVNSAASEWEVWEHEVDYDGASGSSGGTKKEREGAAGEISVEIPEAPQIRSDTE